MTTTSETTDGTKIASSNHHHDSNTRPLRLLIISMGGPRQDYLRQLISQYPDDFCPPVFSPGIPSRSLRSRTSFLETVGTMGLLPQAEWEAVQQNSATANLEDDVFQDIPLSNGSRRGSPADLKVHYTTELWQKAKTINRGRAVLACALAHLRAMKTFVEAEEAFDVLLEDNVRLSPEHSAERIRAAARVSREYSRTYGAECHLRYLGWLGSTMNLQWMHESYIPLQCFRDGDRNDCGYPIEPTVVRFPQTSDIDEYLLAKQAQLAEGNGDSSPRTKVQNQDVKPDPHNKHHTTPGGTPIWGTYAYWVSKRAYEHLWNVLRHDVGALLWKSKRQRYYTVKPIDKILPRHVLQQFGKHSVHVATHPSFFRAPMLTSTIHKQWDAGFCVSTEYQLQQSDLEWKDLALTEAEHCAVEHAVDSRGEWLPRTELERLYPNRIQPQQHCEHQEETDA